MDNFRTQAYCDSYRGVPVVFPMLLLVTTAFYDNLKGYGSKPIFVPLKFASELPGLVACARVPPLDENDHLNSGAIASGLLQRSNSQMRCSPMRTENLQS